MMADDYAGSAGSAADSTGTGTTRQGAGKPSGGGGMWVLVCIAATIVGAWWIHAHGHGFLALLWAVFMGFVTLMVIVSVGDDGKGNYEPSSTAPTYKAVRRGKPRQVVSTYARNVPAVSNDVFRKKAQYWKIDLDGHVDGVVGDPGVGLGSSGFSTDRVQAGQKGEQNLAKLMVYLGIVGRGLNSYWSLRIPGSALDTDVDAIISYGDQLVLIDAKEYVAGDGYVYRNEPGDAVSVWVEPDAAHPDLQRRRVKKYEFSHNMEIALDKYRTAFPSMNVSAVVLLCPTRRGLAAVKAGCSIDGGAIPVTQSWAWLKDLKAKLDSQDSRPTTAPDVDRRLRALLKH